MAVFSDLLPVINKLPLGPPLLQYSDQGQNSSKPSNPPPPSPPNIKSEASVETYRPPELPRTDCEISRLISQLSPFKPNELFFATTVRILALAGWEGEWRI